MVGTLQALRSVPRPTSNVVQEALNLLAVMGGSKDAKALLKEMYDVQVNNEIVLAEAKTIIAEADRRDKGVTERDLSLQQRVKQAEASIISRYEDVTRKEEDLSKRMAEATEMSRLRSEALDEREEKIEEKKRNNVQSIKDANEKLKVWEAKLAEQAEVIRHEEQIAVERRKALDRDETKLAARLQEVEQFKTKLDARDARLLALINEEEAGGEDI